ncbi:MAG TPA: MoxR family ATPase, partial [Desulfobacteraceae bacterium]|nr:MoxR family ATPase [Desulfobacteraceae bacterium]
VKGAMPFLGVLFKKSPDYERAKNLTGRRKLF